VARILFIVKKTLCILVSGFRVFGGGEVNTSEQALSSLAANVEAFDPTNELAVGNIVTKLLNVYWSNNPRAQDGQGAADEIEAAIESTSPDIVIGLGMGVTNDFKVERNATDCDKRLRDERPKKFRPKRRRREFPEDLFARETSLPVQTIIDAMKREGIHNVVSSESAGNYLCEDVFYRIMRVAALKLHGSNILRAGFIHLPLYEKASGVSQTQINKGVAVAIQATLSTIHPSEYATIELPGVKLRADSMFSR
jgi:pyrrolidone-carboxylate peptidase